MRLATVYGILHVVIMNRHCADRKSISLIAASTSAYKGERAQKHEGAGKHNCTSNQAKRGYPQEQAMKRIHTSTASHSCCKTKNDKQSFKISSQQAGGLFLTLMAIIYPMHSMNNLVTCSACLLFRLWCQVVPRRCQSCFIVTLPVSWSYLAVQRGDGVKGKTW